ncbi:MAG: PAS domain-containing protein [Acidobacteriaceae bacterium]|nr:PAS domain-containing protein [Acidobacteriaceae bacterium]
MAEERETSNLNGQIDPSGDGLAVENQFGVAQTEADGPALAPVTTDSPDEADDKKRLPFNVVGIGASAGGVEAYIELLDYLPPNTGMAFVIIAHLLADQKSHLPEILARHTRMRVQGVESGMQVEPDHVYVVPPKALLRMENATFLLEQPDSHAQKAIDFFFFSLAADQKNRSIGVVLSGMDSDGALGLRAIKGEGGITMVQAPETAQYPDMPRSSISADHVDIVLPPAAIASQLAQIGRQFQATNLRLLRDGVPAAGEEQQFNRILAIMRGVSGVDFRLYKPTTIRRRIARRMLLHRLDTLRDYAALLQANPSEVRELQEDALINVTRFFRDPEVFEAFKTTVLPRVLQDRDPSQQIRMWVAGCSTGEEAYSLAICLMEYLTGSTTEPPIQIFGTDASELNIQKARAGLYPETILADVSPERLRRFFAKTEKGYQVSKRIRDLCIFARQNLCHDPPFSRMDVISCRNVLIYFGAELQRQLIPTFHYALRPEGFLLLGTSETIREFTDLFSLADRRHKIYSRAPGNPGRAALDVAPRQVFPELAVAQQALDTWGDLELQRAADRILMARYAPPGVVINDRLEILQSRGRTNPFLELRPGMVTLELGRLLPDSIAPQVTSAVRRAIEEDLPVQVEGLQLRDGGDLTREATLEVLPIHSVGHRSKCYLVVFAPPRAQTLLGQRRTELPTPSSVEDKDRLIAQMRQDLSSTRMYLQSLLEERDAKNQELVSANEEIQSANEELQSTNEELETTKEELQSSNEELHTVNDELQNRNAVLTQASNDLQNLLNSVNLPVLMLSNELTIRHFTPPTQRVMNLRAADIGRPFTELRVNLDVDDLTPLFTEVLETLTAREIEVKDREGHWYLLRVRPYRTADNKIEGLVVALVDIDQLRRSQQELRTARDFSRSIIQGVPLPLVVVDSEFKIRATNKAFWTLSRLQNGDLERRNLPALTATMWGLDTQLREHLEELRKEPAVGKTFEFEYNLPGEGQGVFCFRGCVLQPDDEQFLLVTIEDISSHKEAERLLKTEKERLATEVEVTTQALGRSQEELRALAASLFTSQEEERRRIARELHDDVSQRLAAMEIDGDQVERSIHSDAPGAVAGMQRIREALAALSEDVRTMSHRLHPSIIEDLGLKPALQSLTDEFGRRENMIATFSSRNVPKDLPLEVSTGLYRIAQEALRNVAKHAGQTHARVTLRGTDTGIELQIADFGHGFDVSASRPGLGLLSMEERARHIGGTLDLHSALGEGSRVTVHVPLPKAEGRMPSA